MGRTLSRTSQVIYLTFCSHIQSHPLPCHDKNASVFVKYLPSSSDYLSQQSDSQVFHHLTNDELQVRLMSHCISKKKTNTHNWRQICSQGKGSVQNTESGEWRVLKSSVRYTLLDIRAVFVLGKKEKKKSYSASWQSQPDKQFLYKMLQWTFHKALMWHFPKDSKWRPMQTMQVYGRK